MNAGNGSFQPQALRAPLAFLLLCLAGQCGADGFGWWYESFSWPGFERYFGDGSAADRQLVDKRVRELFKTKQVALLGVDPTPANLERWLALTTKGVSYEGLAREDAEQLDRLFRAALAADAQSPFLDLKPETGEYLTPGTLKLALRLSNSPESSFFRLFKFGRSFGATAPRDSCYADQGTDWYCYDTYVILTPDEVVKFRDEVALLLKHEDVQKDPGAMAELKDLEAALRKVAKSRRGLYLNCTD